MEIETNDEIKLRGRRPYTNKYDKATSLNFQGRVKMSSRKNAQLECKFKTSRDIKMVLQHGKFNTDIFILDYGYPFAPIQAFAYGLGLHCFGGKLK